MTFQREGDPLDVAARAAAAQLRCEAKARQLSDKIVLPEDTTDWDAILCAEAMLIRSLPEPDLRRNASIVYGRYADVAGPEKASLRAANALDAATCDPELLRADLVSVHNETARLYLLGYQVERERGELARFVIFIGLAALAIFQSFISWAFLAQVVEKGVASLIVAVFIAIVVGSLWFYEKRRGKRRRTTAVAALIIVLAIGLDIDAQTATAIAKTPVRIPIMPLVVLAGILGACFSVLQRVQRSWANDPLLALLHLRNARAHIFLSILTGAIASVVMFAIFAGDMISGSLFPKIVNSAKAEEGGMLLVIDFLRSTGPATYGDYGRLLVWAFIAGFAERMVPDILDRFVASAKKS